MASTQVQRDFVRQQEKNSLAKKKNVHPYPLICQPPPFPLLIHGQRVVASTKDQSLCFIFND